MRDGIRWHGFLYLSTKRLFDVALASVGLLAMWPIMVVTAIWVRLDSKGPALYRQKRVGRGGIEFEILKLRTMHNQAEAETGPVWAVTADNRVTRAGRILRRLYLDELPQLVNILRGDMSFVGPRPERAFFYPLCERDNPGFSGRLCVVPGLTGLAQVNQVHDGSPRAVRRKFKYDMFYIHKRSLVMDFSIIVRTGGLLWREFTEIWR